MTVAGLLLAAGTSARYGAENKLLADIGGLPLVRRTAATLLAAGLADVLAVTGHEHESIAGALAGLPVRLVYNPDHTAGMGTSIAAGCRALAPGCPGIMIVPADMPGLTAEACRVLIGAFAAEGGRRIVYASDAAGTQRNPVVWPSRFVPDLVHLEPAQGAKALLRRHRAEAVPVRFAEDGLMADIDTPDDLRHWRRRHPA